MSSESITILPDHNESAERYIPKVKDATMKLVDTLDVDEESKTNLISEAQDILSRCVFPGTNGNITNIAVGYVQSGKTMSFTVLTALAADNGFTAVVYLTGTKTNLQDQTYNRLNSDLYNINDNDTFHIYKDGKAQPANVRDFITDNDCTLLFPILKHHKHIDCLTKIFKNQEVKNLIDKKAILIIDDEADQSSFNTYAKKNSENEDWEEDDYSRTYQSICNLKAALPCHSYVQYTATPQAAFLIDNSDILSPKYFTLLTAGKDYTGGKFFFKAKDRKYVIEIPENEIYHAKRNPLCDRPNTLEQALMQFLVSVAVTVYIQKQRKLHFLSMMIHIDGRQESNEKFKRWTDSILNEWGTMFRTSKNDISRPAFDQKVNEAYDEITKYVDEKPSFDEVLSIMHKVVRDTKTYLVQGNNKESIGWKDGKAHILIGADMLNRGFTIEHLSMTYMPRTPRGKSTADTIEQRCRFFGYKKRYSDIIRIYLPHKSIEEFNDYVDHEEMLRKNLQQCNSIEDFAKSKKVMTISSRLNPTRTNILSKKLIRNKMMGWRQMRTADSNLAERNNPIVEALKNNIANWEYCKKFDSAARNHRVATIKAEDFIEFFKRIGFNDLPNIARKVATIQYIEYLKETGKIDHIKIYDMSCGNLRERKLQGGLPQNLQAGESPMGKDTYPGDRSFKSEETISLQLHHLQIKDPISVTHGRLQLYNFAIYYPESLGQSYVAIDAEEDGDL